MLFPHGRRGAAQRPWWLRARLAFLLAALIAVAGACGGGSLNPPAHTSAPAGGTAGAAGNWWRPPVGLTWQWQLSGTADLSVPAGMFDLDLFETTAATVSAVHAAGARAVCYVETGAWESYRPDAAAFPVSVRGAGVDGYPQERYLDLRQLAVLEPLIAARLDLCRRKGFDGVEPDIDDSVLSSGPGGTGFPLTYRHQLDFNAMVSRLAHERGLAIGLKNGLSGDNPEQFVADMLPLADFAVNEQCWADGRDCQLLTPFITAGKPVFHAEYLTDYPGATAERPAVALSRFCPATSGLRFSSILKDASERLSAWRATCPAR